MPTGAGGGGKGRPSSPGKKNKLQLYSQKSLYIANLTSFLATISSPFNPCYCTNITLLWLLRLTNQLSNKPTNRPTNQLTIWLSIWLAMTTWSCLQSNNFLQCLNPFGILQYVQCWHHQVSQSAEKFHLIKELKNFWSILSYTESIFWLHLTKAAEACIMRLILNKNKMQTHIRCYIW